MASENRTEAMITVDLPEEVSSWLEEEGARFDEPADEFCQRLIHAAYSTQDESGSLDAVSTRQFEDRIKTHNDELMELIEDLRSRIVQVKHEVDQKADAEHDHGLSTVTETVETIERELDELDTQIQAISSRMDDGFSAFEETVSELVVRTDTVDKRTAMLGETLQSERQEVSRFIADRRRVDELKEEANRLDVQQAQCGSCEESIHLPMLTKPRCPNCTTPLDEISEPKWFFGRHTIESRDTPDRRPITEADIDFMEEEPEPTLTIGEPHD